MRKPFLKWIILLFPVIVFAQSKPGETGLVFENDLYTSSVNDKYYTNGFEFFYRYLIKNDNENAAKKILEFRLGQHIYNPQTIRAENIFVNDRPFAGHLFAETGLQTFYKNESVLKLTGQLGVIGPNAFGEEMQKTFHEIFGYKRVSGWQYQIRNLVVIQANAFCSLTVFPSQNTNFDLQFQGEANFGTAFNGINVGPMARFGFKKLLPVYESNLYEGSLRHDRNYKASSEFYFYISPRLNYQLYDATIQGSFFNDNSPVTFDLVPFRFNGEAGLKYRKNSWNLSYTFVYRGKEAKNRVIAGYFFGSIGVAYLL